MSKKRSGKRRSGQHARKGRASAKPETAQTGASPDQGTKAARGASRPAAKSGAKSGAKAAAAVPKAVVSMLVLAGAGIALTAYLTGVTLFGAQPLACGVGSSCDVVQSSRWSTLLGLPLSAWGLATYVTIASLVWKARRRRRAWAQAWVVALVGFAISVYLTVVSVVQIEALCAYCLVSLGLMAALFAGLTVLRPASSGEPALRGWAPGSAIAAVAVVAGLHANYAGVFDPAAGPEKPELRALATHLSETGARFYGAYWCPVCQEQKKLFEASVERLPYVECSPEGRNGPRALECVTKDINSYPTWIIAGRRYEQILDPPELARMSGFEWPAEQVATR